MEEKAKYHHTQPACQHSKRYELAKDILITLLTDQDAKDDVMDSVALYAAMAPEQIEEVYGEHIPIEDVPNYVFSIKAISLADTFLKLLDR